MAQIMGWFFAAFVAPYVRRMAEGTFPILMVWGAPSAGKTQLLKRLWIMHGMDWEIETFTGADTKRFTTMKYISESNTLPVIFDEYRRNEDPRQKVLFNSLIRETFNAGQRTRGRPDLTQEIYDLTAPTVVAGETPFGPSDAMQDRAVHVELEVKNQRPDMWARLGALPLEEFNAGFYTHALGKDLKSLWRQSVELIPQALRELSQRQADVWTTLAFGLRLMEPFWTEEQTQKWIEGFTAFRTVTHEGMVVTGIMPEIVAVLAELIKARSIKETSEYVIRDEGSTMWFMPATVLRQVETHGKRIGTEHPLTVEVMERALRRDAETADPVVLKYKEPVKIAGRSVRGVQLDLEKVEQKYGISRAFWTLEGLLKGGD